MTTTDVCLPKWPSNLAEPTHPLALVLQAPVAQTLVAVKTEQRYLVGTSALGLEAHAGTVVYVNVRKPRDLKGFPSSRQDWFRALADLRVVVELER